MTGPRTLAAAGAAFAAVALFSGLDATIKHVSAAVPLAMVVFLRYASGALFAGAVASQQRIGAPSRATLVRAARRSVVMLVTAALFFAALRLLPLAQTVALTFTAPFFMMILSRLILGEPMSRRGLAAAGLGFVGVLVMLADRIEDGGNPAGFVLALSASFTYALSMILTRRDTAHDSIAGMILSQNLLMTAMALPLALLFFKMPPPESWLAFLAAGALGTFGHLILAWAYKHAPAAVLGPFEFTALIWAVLFGIAFFDETPRPSTLAGAAIIIAACLAASWRRPG